MRKEATVLYVGGMGRSGSTLLERAVAQFPNACGIGEAVFLWKRGLVDDDLCGCGEPFSRCPFWSAVGDRAFGGWDQVDPQRVAELRRRVDDVKFVPRLLFPLWMGGLRSEAEEYGSYYERLYEAVREVSGCSVVVDSSKLTALAYILSHSPRISLRLLHMVRDPRAVAYAWTKRVRRPEVANAESFMPRYSPAYMALLYVGHNFLLELLRLRRVPVQRVRYEDFAEHPASVVEQVKLFAGLAGALEDVVEGDPPHLHLDVAHTVAGNPSRFTTGAIAVRRDEAWRGKMSRTQRRLVTLLTLPSIIRYGYTKRHEEQAPVSEELSQPDQWPTVTTVLPTHARPDLMRRALRSVVAQDYPGIVETIVVFDKAEPDLSLVSDDNDRPVTVVVNTETPGLAGARNTGILGSSAEFVAFLDDDDYWLPNKLSRQVQRVLSEPGSEFASTAMAVEFEGDVLPRHAGKRHVEYVDLLRSRMAMLHSSSFLARRTALIDGIGLVDETMPRSMAEDWDLLLRAARRRPVVHLDEPLVRVRWGPTSFFASDWQVRNDAQLWLLEHHPEMAEDKQAAGLSYGKLAFGAAMMGHRRQALRWSGLAFRADPTQPRTYIALLVSARLLPGDWFVAQLNKRGHGI